MRLTCPNCHFGMTATPELYGQVTSCPSCHSAVRVPVPDGILDNLPRPRGPRLMEPPGGLANPMVWVGISLGTVAIVVLIVVLTRQSEGGMPGRIEESKNDVAKTQLMNIEKACQTYKLRNGEYPADLDALTVVQPDG